MRKILLFGFLLLLSTFVYSETSSSSINWLSEQRANLLYCRQNGDCNLSNFYAINITTISQNVTGIVNAQGLSINGTSLQDIYYNQSQSNASYVLKSGDIMTGNLVLPSGGILGFGTTANSVYQNVFDLHLHSEDGSTYIDSMSGDIFLTSGEIYFNPVGSLWLAGQGITTWNSVGNYLTQFPTNANLQANLTNLNNTFMFRNGSNAESIVNMSNSFLYIDNISADYKLNSPIINTSYLAINQSADSRAINICGYDDRSTACMYIAMNSLGYSAINTPTQLNFYVAGTQTNFLYSGGFSYLDDKPMILGGTGGKQMNMYWNTAQIPAMPTFGLSNYVGYNDAKGLIIGERADLTANLNVSGGSNFTDPTLCLHSNNITQRKDFCVYHNTSYTIFMSSNSTFKFGGYSFHPNDPQGFVDFNNGTIRANIIETTRANSTYAQAGNLTATGNVTLSGIRKIDGNPCAEGDAIKIHANGVLYCG